MDLRAYYRKIREVESSLPEEYVVVVSLPTPEGGREGVFYEVNRKIAARLLVEGRARLAEEKEAQAFREEMRELHRRAKEEELARRIEVTVVSGDGVEKGQRRRSS